MSNLSELIEALSTGSAYPHNPRSIDLVQTQISAVFLADEWVYKVKRPVSYDFLDFTSLEKRRYYCEQEVSLNRRLCPDTYVGVVPVVRSGSGLCMEGQGEPVEYAVKMRRLPSDRMMDNLLPSGGVTVAMIDRVAEKLADFHQHHRINEDLAAIGGLDVLTKDMVENFAEVEPFVDRTISPGQYERIRDYSRRFLDDHMELFDGRVAGGRIRDCHGDLRAAHVCFGDKLCIFDCIEFNDRFRYIDVANEIAFLAMDLDFYDHVGLSKEFVHLYVEYSGDDGLLELLDFYKCYRAYVRGKVEGFKLDAETMSDSDKARARERATRFFRLADGYAAMVADE